MNRRTSILVVFVFFLYACIPNVSLNRFSNTLWNELYTISPYSLTYVAYLSSNKTAELEALIIETLRHMNEVMDNEQVNANKNNLAYLNAQAGKSAVKIDPHLFDLITLSYDWYQKTNGKIDITQGSLQRLWNDHATSKWNESFYSATEFEIGAPSTTELEKAKSCSGWDKVQINHNDRSVHIKDPCVSLFLKDFADAFIVDHLVSVLNDNGYDRLLISHSDYIGTLTSKPNNEPWNVGISGSMRPWPGFKLALSETKDNVIIKNLSPHSTAYKLGLRHDDTVIAFNKEPITIKLNNLETTLSIPNEIMFEMSISRHGEIFDIELTNEVRLGSLMIPKNHVLTTIEGTHFRVNTKPGDWFSVGERMHFILDPITSTLNDAYPQITFIAHNALTGAFLSHASFNLSPQEINELVYTVQQEFTSSTLGYLIEVYEHQTQELTIIEHDTYQYFISDSIQSLFTSSD